MKREGLKKTRRYLTEALVFLAGSALFGLSVNLFIEPGNITMGGFTGISTTLRYFLHTPVGLMILLLNLPLLVLEWRLTGGVWKTALGIAGTSFMTDLLSPVGALYTDPLLCAVFGPLMMGAGSGLLLTRGYTTGGSDLCAFLLSRRWKRLSAGRMILLIDAGVILLSAAVTGRWGDILFSFVAVWCYSTTIDRVLGGFGGARLAIIISDRYAEIAQDISAGLQRGVTCLPAAGWYTGKERQLLLCVVKRSELYALTALIRRTDPGAFVIVSDTSEVLGEGFAQN